MEKYIKSQNGITKEKAEEERMQVPNDPETQQTSTDRQESEDPGYGNADRVADGDTPNMPNQDENAAGTGIPSAE